MVEDTFSAAGPGSEARRPIPRIVSAGVEEALQRFNSPALLAAGKVNMISLDAVERRFGPRWPVRCDQVHAFTTRVLERGVGAQGFFLRISDTEFFIVHAELGALGGQAACLRYLREVLSHFLGEDQLAPLGVFQVTRIARGHVEARQLDDRTEVPTETEAPAARTRRAAESPRASPDQWTPFVASDGRRLRVTATLDPVYELKGSTRIGFRMIRRVFVSRANGQQDELSPRDVASLCTADLLRVDLATIARGIERLKAEGDRQLSLVVPLSYACLSSQNGRAEFVKHLKAAGALVRLGVICEICDIADVPASALLTATALLRPFTLLRVGRMDTTAPGAVARLDEAGLQALSFTCPPGLGDGEFVGWATATLAAARRVTRSVLIYGVASPGRAATLLSLGASHVSFSA